MLHAASSRMIPRVLENVAAMDRHQRNGLCNVQGRTAAQTDHGVGAMFAKRLCSMHDLTRRWIAPDLAEEVRSETGLVEVLRELPGERQRRDTFVGDDQRSLDSDESEMRSE